MYNELIETNSIVYAQIIVSMNQYDHTFHTTIQFLKQTIKVKQVQIRQYN